MGFQCNTALTHRAYSAVPASVLVPLVPQCIQIELKSLFQLGETVQFSFHTEQGNTNVNVKFETELFAL